MEKQVEIREMKEGELEALVAADQLDREVFKLSEQDLEPLKAYIEQRVEPGGFLRAVLCNNLQEAAGRADIRNRRRLWEWVGWLYNYAPGTCWGAPEKVESWLSGEGRGHAEPGAEP